MARDSFYQHGWQDLLADNPALLDALVRAIPLPLAVLDGDLVYRACNRGYAAQLGLAPDTLVNQSHLSLLVDSHVERSLRTVLTHGDPLNIHVLRDHPDAPSAGWRISPLLDASGEAQGLVVCARGSQLRSDLPQGLGAEPGWLSMVRNMQEVFFRADAEGCFNSVSPSVQRLTGFAPGDLEGRAVADFLVEQRDWATLQRKLQAHDGQLKNFDTRLRRRDGGSVWVSINGLFCRDEDGEVCGVEGVARDISERHEAEVRMRQLSRALEQTADAVTITDRDGMIEYVNQAFETTTGYPREDVMGRSVSLLKSGRHGAAFYRNLWVTISRGEAFRDVMINRRRDGSLYYEAKTITPLRDDDGQIQHYISTGKDISERMQAEERLFHMAHHDALTDLPNRSFFINRLEERLALESQHAHAVLFFDLDRFKIINDSLGHELGDAVLQTLAERLCALVEDADDVARLSGDEFAVLLSGDDVDREMVARMSRKVLETVAHPYLVEDQELFLTTSIGISLAPVDGLDASSLLKHADVAMYRAKEMGRNNFQFYSAQMGVNAVQRLTMETSLRRAVERQEFRLFYQPQIDLLNNRVIGVEALLRWQHPELGLVPPSEFIPLLEETRLIETVGDWVLETACRQGQAWREQLGLSLRMAVNLSGRQFTDAALLKRLSRILDDTGFDRQLLELELTESIIMRDDRHSVRMFNVLWDMDVRIAVDDFGTGYSSLSYLKRFPIDTLKIDSSFIRDISTDPDDAAIVQAIIAMASTLNLHVVAEGVETPEQRDFLRARGCHLVQGYLCHKPAPADVVSRFLAENQAQFATPDLGDSSDAAQ
jgi:diguanylate cyclase (GGDEF)-like protein/PAS domain S-box-containing protein